MRRFFMRLVRGGTPTTLYLLAASPLLLLFGLVRRHAVDAFFMDDWQFVPIYEKFHLGTLAFGDLIAPHDEHRLFFPRLILVASEFLSGGDARAQCWVTFGVVAVLSLCVLHLARATARGSWVPAFWFLCNLTICSPIQWQNWLWPIQFIYYIPYLSVALCLCALLAPLPPLARFALCTCAALFASLSMAHGLVVWVALLPLILWHPALAPRRVRLAFFAAWIACAALVGALYFRGLEHNSAEAAYAYGHDGVPPSVSSLKAFQADPLGTLGQMARFVPAIVGGALIRGYPVDNLFAARLVGLGAILLLLAACVILLRRGRLFSEGAPWLAFAVQGFVAATLVAAGRIFRGENQALTPRYTTMGAFCLLGIVGLLAVALAPPAAAARDEGSDAGGAYAMGGSWAWAAPVLAGAYLSLQAHAWMYGARMMANWECARLRGLVPLLFAPHFQNEYLGWPGAHPTQVMARVETLQRLGLWRHPRLPNSSIDNFRHDQPLSSKRGLFRSLLPEPLRPGQPAAPRRWVAQGFATLPTLHRAPDAILFAYRHDPDRAWTVFDLFLPEPAGFQLDNHSHKDAEFTMTRTLRADAFQEWKACVAMDRIPRAPAGVAEAEISAWALNLRRMRAYELPGRHVYRPGQPPGSAGDPPPPSPSQP